MLFIFLSISVFSQDKKEIDSILFSESLAINHSEFERKSSLNFYRGNRKASERFFDSLVEQKLEGSILDNFKVHGLNQKINFIYEFEKPMYLMSYASWCVPSNGELEALQILVEEHSDWMNFVLILWDKKEDAAKFARQFPNKIKVLYVNELDNTGARTIKIIKHKLGVPVSLTVSSNKIILNIRQNTQVHPSIEKELATKKCYEDIAGDIALLQQYESL